MNKLIIVTIVVIAALTFGVTVAFGLSRMMNIGSPSGFSMMGNYNSGSGMMGGNGMMNGYGRSGQQPSGNRISMDNAIRLVQDYETSAGTNFKVAEVMEFENNFYAAVLERDTGRAAFEILVDPYSGWIFPEYGPNMMWNVKYGHMGNGNSPENTVSFDQAKINAQKTLDARFPSAMIEPDGFTFYGYYTFDYKVNDQIAGMLSVNGFDGQVWLHTWHGQFIDEKELAK